MHKPHSAVSNALYLTPEDVQLLLAESSDEGRLEVTHKIAGAYASEAFSAYETMIAEQIFRLLMNDPALRVRVTLAQHVKASKNLPHDIIMTMAQDVNEVALPILKHSAVLTDEDLMMLVRSTKEIARHLAVCERDMVSGNVSDALLETGQAKVAGTLLKNEGAQLQDAALLRILEDFAQNPAVLDAMADRKTLPLNIAEKLIEIATGSLADKLRSRYERVDLATIQEKERQRETETVQLLMQATQEHEVKLLVGQLQNFGRLTPSIILSALCRGNSKFFEHSLALLSKVTVENTRTLLSDRGELGFRALYNKAGLPEGMFPAVKLLLNVVRELAHDSTIAPTDRNYANRVVEHLLHAAEEHPVENLAYIIALVRK